MITYLLLSLPLLLRPLLLLLELPLYTVLTTLLLLQ